MKSIETIKRDNAPTLRISAELALPLDWITLATVVYGARGSGKTSFGRVCAEEATKARQRFCAIDLKGDWYGLTSSADGKSEGLPVVIFGGEHAHVPLEPDAGAFVGETVAKLEQSCILDFELFSKGKQIRFLASFFEALYHHNREPLLLLLDEAQRYAPQKPGPDEARTLGAVQDLVKLGRKHGIGPVLFTQRGAGLSKEVSELCDMMVAFRTPGPLDQDRVRDWLDANTTRQQRDQVMGTLSGLATGTAVFASGHPDLKIFGAYGVRRPETFDSSATPKVGQRRAEPKKLAAPDLVQLKERMASAIERAKADDPKALRARIAELEKELKKKAGAASTKVVERVEVPVFDKEALGILRSSLLEHLSTARGNIVDAMNRYAAIAGKHKAAMAATTRDAIVVPISAQTDQDRTSNGATPRWKPPANSSQSRPNMPKTNGAEKLGRCETAILTALAQRHPRPSSASQAAILSGYSVNSSTFQNGVSALRTAGLAEGPGRELRMTDAGVSWVGPVPPAPEVADRISLWHGKLGKCERTLLKHVWGMHPKSVTRAELAEEAGYSVTSSTFQNGLSTLRVLDLIVSDRGGPVALSQELVG